MMKVCNNRKEIEEYRWNTWQTIERGRRVEKKKFFLLYSFEVTLGVLSIVFGFVCFGWKVAVLIVIYIIYRLGDLFKKELTMTHTCNHIWQMIIRSEDFLDDILKEVESNIVNNRIIVDNDD